LKPIHEFKAKNPDQLYRNVKNYDWSSLFSHGDTLAIDGVVNSDFFKHSKYAALKVKDAIVDQIRDKTGKRPDVELNQPTYRINIHIEQDNCSLLLDSSGDSLHKRGYRIHGGFAPLNEVLAAGMISLSEWDLNSNFVDIMCGSGTLVIEALLMAKNIAPNINRNHFGFMNWDSFDRNRFNEVRNELISKQKETSHTFIANDISHDSIKIAQQNAIAANVESNIKFVEGDFSNLKHDFESGIIITNPPYDERLKVEDTIQFYKKIGDALKKNFNGFEAWILSSNKEAIKNLGLRTSRRLLLFNGALECKFHNYKLYQGSLKRKHGEN
jgi:putative N6-adenine-specific DNA methylase